MTLGWGSGLTQFTLAASLALVLGGTAVGIWFPPDLQVAYHPPAVAHALSAPVRRGSGEQSSARLEKALATLPPVLALRHAAFELGEGDLWREMRHNPIHGPSGTIGNTNMLASALFGPEKIAIPPFLRERRDGRESVLIVHVGNNLCGHDGIVHGGLVATLFDQYLYRHGVQNLDAGIAATAHLSVNYRAPVRANQFLVMKSTREEDSRKPHKVIIQGRLEDVNGNLLAEAKYVFFYRGKFVSLTCFTRGVFVTPKDAKNFFKPTAGSAAPPSA